MGLSPLAQKMVDKRHEHRPQVKFGLEMFFNTQVSLKDWGRVLITKFDKAEKIGCSGFLF
jgi:hypothetical protein